MLLLLTMSCSRAPEWSDAERESARHYVRSLEASSKAAQVIRKSNPDVPKFGVDEINEYERLALSEARLVDDALLDRAHAELKEHFRSEYQKGLELTLKSYEGASLSSSGSPLRSEVDLQASGVALLQQWTVWINAHGREINMPDDSPMESRKRGEPRSHSSASACRYRDEATWHAACFMGTPGS